MPERSPLIGRELQLEYRPHQAASYDLMGRIQLSLDATVKSEHIRTLVFHASSEIADMSDKPPTYNGGEREIGVLRFDPSEYGCLVIRLGAIGRTYVMTVEKEKIGYVDQLIHAAQTKDFDMIEINTQTLLLNSERLRTGFSHSAQTLWPIGMVRFFWTDIASEPAPESDPS